MTTLPFPGGNVSTGNFRTDDGPAMTTLKDGKQRPLYLWELASRVELASTNIKHPNSDNLARTQELLAECLAILKREMR